MKLFFFTTAGCHLCDKAKALIWSLPATYTISLEFIDVADSDELIARYGTRIPVVSKAKKPTESVDALEIAWPFTQDELIAFISG